MKKTFLIFAILLSSLTASAQSPFHFTVKAGMGTSHFWGKQASSDTNIAWKAGIGAEYNFNSWWSIRSGLDVVRKGGNDQIDGLGQADIHAIYLELPLMPTLSFPLQKDIHGFIGIGPYISIGLGGTTTGSTISESSSLSSPFKANTFGNIIDGNMGYRRFDVGAAFTVGLEYHRFILSAEAQMGCMQVNKQLEQLIMLQTARPYCPKNFSAFFTLAYRFL